MEGNSAEKSPRGGGGGGGQAVSDYEKARILRIRENKARLQALGITHLASSVLGGEEKGGEQKGNRNKKGKKRRGEVGSGAVDEEYRPSDQEEHDENGEDTESSSSGEGEDGDDWRPSRSHRQASKKKGKKANSSNETKVRKTLNAKGKMRDEDVIDEDAALQQAIALSLGVAEDIAVVSAGLSYSGADTSNAGKKKGIVNTPDNSGRRRKRKENYSRVQLTEDEMIAYFFSFDGSGKSYLSIRDIQRMAVTHDFSWTEMEMGHMIHCFDSNGDGKLSLDDFRTIVTRCNMIKDPGNS